MFSVSQALATLLVHLLYGKPTIAPRPGEGGRGGPPLRPLGKPILVTFGNHVEVDGRQLGHEQAGGREGGERRDDLQREAAAVAAGQAEAVSLAFHVGRAEGAAVGLAAGRAAEAVAGPLGRAEAAAQDATTFQAARLGQDGRAAAVGAIAPAPMPPRAGAGRGRREQAARSGSRASRSTERAKRRVDGERLGLAIDGLGAARQGLVPPGPQVDLPSTDRRVKGGRPRVVRRAGPSRGPAPATAGPPDRPEEAPRGRPGRRARQASWMASGPDQAGGGRDGRVEGRPEQVGQRAAGARPVPGDRPSGGRGRPGRRAMPARGRRDGLRARAYGAGPGPRRLLRFDSPRDAARASAFNQSQRAGESRAWSHSWRIRAQTPRAGPLGSPSAWTISARAGSIASGSGSSVGEAVEDLAAAIPCRRGRPAGPWPADEGARPTWPAATGPGRGAAASRRSRLLAGAMPSSRRSCSGRGRRCGRSCPRRRRVPPRAAGRPRGWCIRRDRDQAHHHPPIRFDRSASRGARLNDAPGARGPASRPPPPGARSLPPG